MCVENPFLQIQSHVESITKMLADLHWPTLQNHRKQALFILMFKIVNGDLIAPVCCLPPSPTITCTRANHPMKYAHLQSNMDIYKIIFLSDENNGTIYKLKISKVLL